MTLPLIHALETASKQEKNFLLSLLKGPKNERIAKLKNAREIIRTNGGFEYAGELAEKLVDTGIASLDIFSSEQSREPLGILTNLAKYVISRDK